MKSKTQRIPVQHMSRFYCLSFSQQPKQTLPHECSFEVLLSLLGASIGIIVTPFVVIGNTIEMEVVLYPRACGKDGVVLKF
jgi:hypothetical protein